VIFVCGLMTIMVYCRHVVWSVNSITSSVSASSVGNRRAFGMGGTSRCQCNYISGMTVRPVGSTDTIKANSNDAMRPRTAIAQTIANSDQNTMTARESWEWPQSPTAHLRQL
jgi:hypothetical protein